MKQLKTGRSTQAPRPSAISTWRTGAAMHERAPVRIAANHLEKEQHLDTALDEYCQLREQDRSLTASRFCERYPSYRHSLRRLIDVHEALAGQPDLKEVNWPELFSEFLGYEILHELGVGAIARVYLATEAALGGRLVAIKIAQEGGDEAETLGKLSHPNIVPVFSVKHDEATGLSAVCMPYHGSATLADLLEFGFQAGSPPTQARVILEAAREREQLADFMESSSSHEAVDPILSRGNYVDGIVRLAIQMAEALAYTHERGILHRDLKPSNVLLTPSGVPMLLDFNLASDIEMGAVRLGGTLPYMPPEQIRDVHLQPFEADVTGDPRSDIFSLAVILYELLTGKLPFGDPPTSAKPRQAAEEYLAAQQQAPQSVRARNPAVSPEFAQLLHQCLALEPSERPDSAASLAAELQKYFSPSRRLRRWTARRRGAVTTLALVFLLTASMAIWHLATRPTYAVREFNAGVDDIERGRHRDAIEHLDRAIKLHADSVPFRFARGVAYQRLGDHKQAEIDLANAAKPLDDAVIMECCAYSQMKMPLPASGPRVAARFMYNGMSSLIELSAEAELNWAFANYDGRPVPALVIARCNAAIAKQPDWQAAYYLRALGHFSAAVRELDVNRRESQGHRLAQSIRDARADFERAIAIGPASERLFTDAAQAYMIPSANPPTERLQQLLRSAVLHGMPQSLIQSLGKRHNWLGEPWFEETVSLSSASVNANSVADYAERFLTPPNDELVDSRLSAYRRQLALEP